MEHPTGILIPIGGAEDRGTNLDPESRSDRRRSFFRSGVLQAVTALLPKGAESAIEVVTAACSEPREAFEEYRKAFEKLGYPLAGHMDMCRRANSEEERYTARAAAADLILMAGGDQLRLSSILSGTSLLCILQERYAGDALIIAGTSAGAMVMGQTMIAEGSAKEAHRKGTLMMAPGFSLLSDSVVDTHFNQRGRFNRIAQAVTAAPGVLGIGLDEDTGVVIREGRLLEVIGSGTVTIVDGHGIGYNNIGNIGTDEPLTVEGLRVHLMARGACFDRSRRCVLPISAEPETESA